jgi:hypothetical protein
MTGFFQRKEKKRHVIIHYERHTIGKKKKRKKGKKEVKEKETCVST